MKRYAIVRVDMIERKDSHDFVCPEHFEGINGRFVCASHYGKKYFPFAHCEDCRYGDTKEQLIRKIAQVIKRVTNDGYVIAYKKFGTGYINTVLKNAEVAKEIVEFLGVK